jgi:hypothetical protein
MLHAQRKTENLIIITTDGMRWQEVFNGMDSAIANNKAYYEDDSTVLYERYWASTAEERRKKIFPFLWNNMVPAGQIYGNRALGNNVDTKNSRWISFPGYSEMMTGFVDTGINRNDYPPNPNVNVLEFLNKQPKFKNKVVAFGAWEAFDNILNEKRAGFPVMSAFNPTGGQKPTVNEKMLNKLLHDSFRQWGEDECFDVFTHHEAVEWINTRKPKIIYIAYGETDEWAHSGRYRSYLDAAHNVDQWISELWSMLQRDPQYKGKTTLIFTTDHGRGDINKDQWTSHNSNIPGAHEMWFAVMGPDTPVRGEAKEAGQIYQQQIAQTIAGLVGYTFEARHPVADGILSVFKMKK